MAQTSRSEQDPRPLELRRQHFEVERALADRLRNASREERRTLYRELYDELYRRVPHHPMLVRKATEEQRAAATAAQMRFLKPLVKPGIGFLEIGAGDCALSFEVARTAAHVVAIDVSDEITRTVDTPANFELRLTDGSSIPLAGDSVDVAFSHQTMEHLHPEDALDQLREIRRVLRPGGVYVCVTPHRLTGPHDISRDFDSVARGFHLKEYTVEELAGVFREAGFAKVDVIAAGKGRFVRLPVGALVALERAIGWLPHAWRRTIGHRFPFSALLLNVQLAGRK